MSVHRYETADGTRWRVRWRDSGGKMHSRSLPTRRDAAALDADIKARKLRAEMLPQPGRRTLQDAWNEWWSTRGEDLAPATQANYRAVWRAHVDGALDRHQLAALIAEPKVIEDFMADLRRRGVGAATRRKILMVLSAVFRGCVEWRWVPVNPIRDLRKPPAAAERQFRPLPPLVIELIRQKLVERSHRQPRGTGDACLVSVMSYAGLRPQEALALTWADLGSQSIAVDKALRIGGDGPVVGPTKTRKSRVVPLVTPLAGDLAEWRDVHPAPDDEALIFPAGRGNGLWSRTAQGNWRNRVWRPAVSAVADTTAGSASIRAARPYDCRGSFVSLQLRAGASALEVAQWAGHSPQVMFRHYAAVIEELVGQPRLEPATQIEGARRAVAERPHDQVSALVVESLKPPAERHASADAILYGNLI